MTGRNRNNVKIETTIENCRSEGKWQKVIELAEELKSSSLDYGNRKKFLLILDSSKKKRIIIFFLFRLQNVCQIF